MNSKYYFHITWATKYSRKKYINLFKDIYWGEKVLLNDPDRKEIFNYIILIAKEFQIDLIELNVLNDHVHLIAFCRRDEIPNIVRRFKSKSTYLFKKTHNIDTELHLWQSKYNCAMLRFAKQIKKTSTYVRYNHRKHNLVAVNDFK